jgi:undecaprenyl-diphosphatase
MMIILVVVLLGVVEGLTEFIPVSSTGHLIIAEYFLKQMFGTVPSLPASFEVAIQLGAILAVVRLYPQRFFEVFKSTPGVFSGARAISIYFLSCFPVLIMGALFHSTIKEQLFSVSTVAWALIVGGVLLLVAERMGGISRRSVEEITFRDALIVGVVQCLALWPGMSRSGSTLFAGRLLGIEKRVAAEFSFMIAVPVIAAAVFYDLYKDVALNGLGGLHYSLLGGVVAYFVAVRSMRWFVALLGRVSLIPFASYRFFIGGLLLLLS